MSERLREVLERVAKATPGEWHTCLGSGEHLMTAVAADVPDNKTVLIADCLPEYALKEGWVVKDHRPNIDLIAHAPDDLAAMAPVVAAALRAKDANDEWLALQCEYPVHTDPDFHGKVSELMAGDFLERSDQAATRHLELQGELYAACDAFDTGAPATDRDRLRDAVVAAALAERKAEAVYNSKYPAGREQYSSEQGQKDLHELFEAHKSRAEATDALLAFEATKEPRQ